MAYVEKKRIGGKEYFYLSRNIRVSPGKWKKIRKYVGADLSNLALAEKELSLVQPVRRLMTAKQMKIVDRIKAAYAAKHKIGKSLWKTEKERMVGFVYNTNAIEGNSLSYEDTKGVLEGKKPKADSGDYGRRVFDGRRYRAIGSDCKAHWAVWCMRLC